MGIESQVLPFDQFTFDGVDSWDGLFFSALSPGDLVVVFAEVFNPSGSNIVVGSPIGGDDGGTGEAVVEQADGEMIYSFVADQDFLSTGSPFVTNAFVSVSGMWVNPNPLINPPVGINIRSQSGSPPSVVGVIVYPAPFNSIRAFPTDVPYDMPSPPYGVGDGGFIPEPSMSSIDPLGPSSMWLSWAAGYQLHERDESSPGAGDGFIRFDGPSSTDTATDAFFTESTFGEINCTWPMVAETGFGTDSQTTSWLFSDVTAPVDERRYYRGAITHVAIGVNPDYDPFDPVDPPGGAANGEAFALHIPHKEYAQGSQLGNVIHKYTANWTAIEQWANRLRCSGVIPGDPGGEGGGTPDITLTPTNAPWKETRLHIPHKTTFSARHIHENYLAFERWARLICPYCHIPHKEWFATHKNPQQEMVNLLTIERWARDISRCCEGIEGEDPDPGGG